MNFLKTRRGLFWAVLILLGLVSTGVFIALRSFGDPALQAYVAELHKRGEKLTLDELTAGYSRQVPGWVSDVTNQVAILGAPPVEIDALHLAEFAAPDRARVTWNLERPPWAGADTNQTHTNLLWTDLSEKLVTSAAELRRLQQLLSSPAPNSGRPTNYFESRPIWKEMRSAAGWLACQTLVSLREGRKDDALASLKSLSGLANACREDFVMAHQMARVAVAGVGLDLTWEALQADGWTEEQLAALQQCWEGHDFLGAVQLALEGERALPLQVLALIRQRSGRLPDYAGSSATSSDEPWPPGKPSLYQAAVLPNDALYGLRHLQHEVELVRQLNAGRPYRQVIDSLSNHEAVLAAKAKSITRICYPISLICIPEYRKAVTTGAQAETKRRLAVTALALRRHQLRHGQWPNDLAALVPHFLQSVPRDCMDGKPLKYHLKRDETWTLYSAGVDGLDHGGDPTPAKAGITRLGEGRDAVWPTALRDALARPR